MNGATTTVSANMDHKSEHQIGYRHQLTLNSLTRHDKNQELKCFQNQEPSIFHHVKLDSLAELKCSTKKLLSLLNIIQETDDNYCTIYKRLTRQCHCLNQHDYNDFIIQFNDCAINLSSTIGEIIKNLRILKKFLYNNMGGVYVRRALKFLNEGLSNSNSTERFEIVQGCAQADICNVFDDNSLVVVCISWPCTHNTTYGDATTQALAASLLYKLAQSKEGQNYLKFTSKITNDLNEVLRKNSDDLEYKTLRFLNAAFSLMNPLLVRGTSVKRCYYKTRSMEDIKSKQECKLMNGQSRKSIKRLATIQAIRSVTNFTLKRKKLIPIYTH